MGSKAKVNQESYYVVTCRDATEGHIVELKARKIVDSILGLSFIQISDFLFDTQQIVVKPSEEQQRKKFEDVKSLHLSIYSIISITEKGANTKPLKFRKDRSNLVTFPREM